MSMPNIPDINPEITLTKDNAVNVILSSIGLEEIALSHFLNAEAEKIQYVVGTLDPKRDAQGKITVNKRSENMLKKMIAEKER